MKCKPIIYIILMLAMIQLAWGVTCEISEDNITFATINSTRYMGCADASSDIGIVNKLDCETEYTIRCKDAATDWGYETFTTESCGSDIGGEINMIAIALTYIMLIVGFSVIGSTSKGFGVKFFGYAYAVIEGVFLAGLIYVNQSGGSLVNLLRINFYVLAIVGFGIAMIALFIHSLRTSVFEDEGENIEDEKWDIDKW